MITCMPGQVWLVLWEPSQPILLGKSQELSLNLGEGHSMEWAKKGFPEPTAFELNQEEEMG